jgi:thioredoxin reductase
MESWRQMPHRMHLKSVWSASSLADPDGSYTLDRYCEAQNVRPMQPIPLSFFLEYADWFQRHAVPDVEPARVQCLSSEGGRLRLALSDGSDLHARLVVVAVGHQRFAHKPEFASGLPAHLASHTGEHVDFSGFRDSTVAVVGSGQSALESAAFLSEAGARVELIARGAVVWIQRKLYGRGGPLRHLFYPPTDVGPPGLNLICGSPLLMSRLPAGMRQGISSRAMRPAGAQWLRPRVEGKVPITARTQVLEVHQHQGGLRLGLSDGTRREVDHLMLGTGYRPDVRGISFLDPGLARQVRHLNGYPILNERFEASVPGLHFVGGLAGFTFGPICRFVAGAKATARQVARQAATAS